MRWLTLFCCQLLECCYALMEVVTMTENNMGNVLTHQRLQLELAKDRQNRIYELENNSIEDKSTLRNLQAERNRAIKMAHWDAYDYGSFTRERKLMVKRLQAATLEYRAFFVSHVSLTTWITTLTAGRTTS